MTSDDRSQQERRLDDEHCVDALLAEGGFRNDAELRAVLLQLRELRVTEVPEPSPEVAALMDRPDGADVVFLEDWTRRHPKKKRIVFTTLAVAASLGVAGGAAAGNQTLRSQAEGTISGIIRSFSPPVPAPPEPTTTAPAPPSSAEAPKPAPAVVPSPAWPLSRSAVPAAPKPKAAATAGERQLTSPAPKRGKAPQQAGAPLEAPQIGGQSGAPGASRGEPANGYAKGKAQNDVGTGPGGAGQGGTGQGSGQSKVPPAQRDRR